MHLPAGGGQGRICDSARLAGDRGIEALRGFARVPMVPCSRADEGQIERPRAALSYRSGSFMICISTGVDNRVFGLEVAICSSNQSRECRIGHVRVSRTIARFWAYLNSGYVPSQSVHTTSSPSN